MNTILTNAVEHWPYVAPLVNVPRSEADYQALVAHLDVLLDQVGDNERHPLAGLVDLISDHIIAYEAEHHPPPRGSGVNALRVLMKEQGLTQSDFKKEIGSQGVVSEILNGHRQLTLKHIKHLAERFNVSPETFID
jgi:HTH-type transcriptional regulator/antitoxin HigA